MRCFVVLQTAVCLGLGALVTGCGGKHVGEKSPVDSADSGTEDDGLTRLTILHTNDWQSHLLGWGPNAEYTPDLTGDDSTVGGLARTKTLVDEIRGSSSHPVVLYDGGDWMAGALFQLLAVSDAAELQIAEAIGYDAMTIGNHEFDWGPDVLGQMISTADGFGVSVPLIASNIVPDTADSGDDSLESHFDSGRIQSTRVDVLDNGVSIGLFGLVGDEAAGITPGAAPTTFLAAADAAALAVETLQAQNVDIIIGLTHNGVGADPATSADEVLATEVPGIDVIVGGHSHTALDEPRTVGNTVIVQAGAYTRYLGQLDLVNDGSGWVVEAYTLHEIDDNILGDEQITSMVEGFLTSLDEGPLQEIGIAFDEPVASIADDVVKENCAETGLGDLITDAYRESMNLVAEDPIDFAFESQGVIRDDMMAGATGLQTFSDVFRVLPLGVGTDQVPGYALVDFYVTADQIKDTCEITASISPSYGCDYFVEMSGLRCTLNMEQSIFNRTRKVEVEEDGEWVELDTSSANTELYHVAVDSYVASLMSILGDLTYDAIVITPMTAQGEVIEDVDDMLFDADPTTDGVQELKLWEALMQTAASFEDTDGDGIADVPESYNEGAGRLIGYE